MVNDCFECNQKVPVSLRNAQESRRFRVHWDGFAVATDQIAAPAAASSNADIISD